MCLSFIFLAPTWFVFASLTKSSNGTSKFLYPYSISFQNVYGRFGKKPNKKLIQEYEQLALGNCDALKLSRMLKVTVSRYSATLHLIFHGFFKPQSNFSSSSINLNKKKAVVWNLKGALMLGAMKPLSMKRNLKNKCRDWRAIQEEWENYYKGNKDIIQRKKNFWKRENMNSWYSLDKNWQMNLEQWLRINMRQQYSGCLCTSHWNSVFSKTALFLNETSSRFWSE